MLEMVGDEAQRRTEISVMAPVFLLLVDFLESEIKLPPVCRE